MAVRIHFVIATVSVSVLLGNYLIVLFLLQIMLETHNSVIGKFHSLADLKHYQTLWQSSTFEPAWKALQEQVSYKM